MKPQVGGTTAGGEAAPGSHFRLATDAPFVGEKNTPPFADTAAPTDKDGGAIDTLSVPAPPLVP